MKLCEKCNKTYGDDQNFCYFCGSQLITCNETGKKCKCGRFSPADSRFCVFCGEDLEEQPLPPVNTASPLKVFAIIVLAFVILAA
ncbi:MAG: hypothetical protein IKM06_06825, partial [Clostridia bacterium]|nr:hypothetical protein [Clostridia bacterium]